MRKLALFEVNRMRHHRPVSRLILGLATEAAHGDDVRPNIKFWRKNPKGGLFLHPG